MIHYQVVGRSLAKPSNFTGTCIYELKEAIKDKEELPGAASLLRLLIGKPDEEKEDLDNLRKAFKKG